MKLNKWRPQYPSGASIGAIVGKASESSELNGAVCSSIDVLDVGVLISYSDGRLILDRGPGHGEVGNDRENQAEERQYISETNERADGSADTVRTGVAPAEPSAEAHGHDQGDRGSSGPGKGAQVRKQGSKRRRAR